MPARDYTDGTFGFLTTQALEYEGAVSKGPAQSIVAFESRGDAQEVQWLWDSWPEAGAGRNKYAALLSNLPEQQLSLYDGVCISVIALALAPSAGQFLDEAVSGVIAQVLLRTPLYLNSHVLDGWCGQIVAGYCVGT